MQLREVLILSPKPHVSVQYSRLRRIIARVADRHVDLGDSHRGNGGEGETEEHGGNSFSHHGWIPVTSSLLRVVAGIADRHIDLSNGHRGNGGERQAEED